MSKKYQSETSKNTAGLVVSVPAEVTVALEELTGLVSEGCCRRRWRPGCR